MACAVKTVAGVGLCMAALGLWLVPSIDATAQLTKLCGSMFLLAIGAYLILMRKEPDTKIVEADNTGPKCRMREYDARGSAKLREY